jgi:hypothetical protein
VGIPINGVEMLIFGGQTATVSTFNIQDVRQDSGNRNVGKITTVKNQELLEAGDFCKNGDFFGRVF